ncbi:single-stranded-DNA-specific exonuclease RecJ [Spirulina sp. CCNP1310]|uniref:single-stranded-DNA-specific exonuclease RecJ n=1 Tax=Spirulina sp. CCNP1310 TaxID=3110249 RepID=UPI002B207D7A|nr:single-stranded-DNA-specific exonuclease RecJ [Spirulina sp. CCNP1310]MEA5419370.1 single-stranded-DNA-specific exonuclease RecJ [Spirulina sp. CCNP1310]
MEAQWQLAPQIELAPEFLNAVARYVQTELPTARGEFVAQLLWQRGIREPHHLETFLNANAYPPASPFAFGVEMEQAVARIQQAREQGEKVAIWGDFDADGLTATSVLWEGLGQFFPPEQLTYTIPNRERESHGLNIAGLDRLAQAGFTLIITCDTGSTNLAEIDHGQTQGLDFIITDHHTLPPHRPPVTAIVNPRYFPTDHPLYHLSGVAVAYKLIEALYLTLPDVATQPVTELLDLVAIGLIADLVALQGDCRYLAQMGLEQLKQQNDPRTATRPGVAQLLALCKRGGDRPTDISFGIGPRINAVSRIQGDARFCVELLTSEDPAHCQQLAEQTELANTRRKELQKNTLKAVETQIATLDLSTTNVIVLADPQWSGGVLGLVAGQVAQTYGRPTILLHLGNDGYARGSARSTHGIDLYELVLSQQDLLHRFGGHPFAAGLSLKQENLPLFIEGINQALRRKLPDPAQLQPIIAIDLQVTVADLGANLFDELKYLEPCGMGNPAPLLLLKNCRFRDIEKAYIYDRRGKYIQYRKTEFLIYDTHQPEGFPGVWWGHSPEEISSEIAYDAVVELDSNTYKKRYEVRLMDLHLAGAQAPQPTATPILDWRQARPIDPPLAYALQNCPVGWEEVQQGFQRAIAQAQPLALAYHTPNLPDPATYLQRLITLGQALAASGERMGRSHLQAQLQVNSQQLDLSLEALAAMGFALEMGEDGITIGGYGESRPDADQVVEKLWGAIAEAQFRHHYFTTVPLPTIAQNLKPTAP